MKIIKILKITIAVVICSITALSLWHYLYINRIEEGLVKVNARNFTGIENLELTGIIYSFQKVQNKLQGYGGRGIIRVNIIESNMDEYDPRNKQANYFCIIKEGKAEIYGWGHIDLKEGDTLKLSIPKRTMNFPTAAGNNIEIKDIWIGHVDFFNYIKEKGYQEL